MQIAIILAICVAIFLAAFPLKNYLILKKIKKDEAKWANWLAERPNAEEYCKLHNFDFETPLCDYCKNDRLLPNLEMVLPYQPKFGFIDISVSKRSYFKTYICAKCGSQPYREKTIAA
jgi:hypothetical protein